MGPGLPGPTRPAPSHRNRRCRVVPAVVAAAAHCGFCRRRYHHRSRPRERSGPPPPLVDEDDRALKHFNIRSWEDYPSDSDVMTSDDEDEQPDKKLQFAKPARTVACVPCAPPA